MDEPTDPEMPDPEMPDDQDSDEEDGWERPIDRFRKGATGSVIAAGLLGLADALEGRRAREEVAIEQQASEPERTGPVEVVLDFEHPERSVAIVRPSPPATDDGAGADGTAPAG